MRERSDGSLEASSGVDMGGYVPLVITLMSSQPQRAVALADRCTKLVVASSASDEALQQQARCHAAGALALFALDPEQAGLSQGTGVPARSYT